MTYPRLLALALAAGLCADAAAAQAFQDVPPPPATGGQPPADGMSPPQNGEQVPPPPPGAHPPPPPGAHPPPPPGADASMAPPPPPPAPGHGAGDGTTRFTAADGSQVTLRTGTQDVPQSGPAPDFEVLDADGDGSITPSEAERYPLLANDFKYADSNRNGSISSAEYTRWRSH